VAPRELTLELVPQARLDVIDVRARAAELHGDVLEAYSRCLCCSFHTTAGYLEQSLALRLSARPHGVRPYLDLFRTLFPQGAGYRHDELDQRTELSHAQRSVEPTNGDSHLAFMAAGLHACLPYVMRRTGPVYFVDLDGVNGSSPRRRMTTLVGYDREEVVARTRIAVPVSRHTVDAVNLKAQQLGLYAALTELITRHKISKGRIRLELPAGEQHAALTVNEYETLLMRHDLADVLRNPLRFAVERARHALADPRAVPQKALDYAKYDLVRAFNRLVDVFGLGESRIERLAARFLAVPASRFLQMKRSVNLLVSDSQEDGRGAIVEGTYQSPILVQWRRTPRRTRSVEVTLTRFE
jgi:thiamine phosphate synthase YjbQ (UPF0047 family)